MALYGPKIIVYVICSVVGAVVAYLFFPESMAAYVSILLSYHLYLAYLVVTASHEKALSMSIGMTVVNHLAFLAALVGVSYSREHIPFFGLIKYLIPALAPFETQWLFSGKGKKPIVEEEPRHQMADATVDDHEAFREHMMQSHRPFRKPGISIAEEFNLWLVDRQKKSAQAEALAAAAAAAAKALEAATGSPTPVETTSAKGASNSIGLGLTDWMRASAPSHANAPESPSKPQSPAPASISPLNSDTERKESEPQEYSPLFGAQKPPPLPTAAFSSESLSEKKESQSREYSPLRAVETPPALPEAPPAAENALDVKEPQPQEAASLLAPAEILSSVAPSDRNEPEPQQFVASPAIENLAPIQEAPLPSESPNGQTNSGLQDYLALFAVQSADPRPAAPLSSNGPSDPKELDSQEYLALFAVPNPTPPHSD